VNFTRPFGLDLRKIEYVPDPEQAEEDIIRLRN
jgi:hypothetical protein